MTVLLIYAYSNSKQACDPMEYIIYAAISIELFLAARRSGLQLSKKSLVLFILLGLLIYLPKLIGLFHMDAAVKPGSSYKGVILMMKMMNTLLSVSLGLNLALLAIVFREIKGRTKSEAIVSLLLPVLLLVCNGALGLSPFRDYRVNLRPPTSNQNR